MESAQRILWEKDYYDSFILADSKKNQELKKRDLKGKVNLDSKFNYLSKISLDFRLMEELGTEKYSYKKVPKTLAKTLSQFSERKMGNLSLYDLFWLYISLNSLFDGKINSKNLKKWKKENKENISFFGISQYELMEKYLKKLDLI